MPRRGGKRQGAGRKPKPKIELKANKGIASTVLATLGGKYKNVTLPSEQDLWFGLLLQKEDPRLRLDTLKYLTDRRDGKPAQGVFVGDTRETARDLDFGDLPMPSSDLARKAGKPN